MAIPTVVAAGTVASGTGGVSPGVPAGYAADDIFLLFCETNGETVSTPSGWTIAPDSPVTDTGAGTCRLSVFYRRATASESAPSIADPGNHIIARILAIRGCVTSGSPFDVSEATPNAGDTPFSVAGVTTTVADCLIVVAVAETTDSTSAQFSGWTNAGLSSLTEWLDNFTTSGAGGGFGVVTGGKATAGATGDTTGDNAGGFDHCALTYALKPVTSTTYNQSVLATTTPATRIVRSAGKIARATTTPLRTIIRSTAKFARATTTPAAALLVARVTLVALQAASTLAASLTHQAGKLVRATTTPAAAIIRSVTKSLLAATTPVASLLLSTAKTMTATTTPAALVQRGAAVTLAAATAIEAMVVKAAGLALRATAGAVATVGSASVFSVILQGSAYLRASLARVLRLFWTPQSPTPETWTPQTPTAETWVTQSPTAETWTPQTPTSETWIIQTPTPETWT